MKKIKILYEGISSNLGGIEVFVHNLIEHMDLNKYEVSIMLDNDIITPFQDEYLNKGIRIIRVTGRKHGYKKFYNDLKNLYMNNDFDIIHINVMSYSIFERITLACKYSKAKVIVHSHNAGFSKDSKYKKTILLDKIGRIFVAPYQKKLLKVACGEKAGKFAFKNDKFDVFNNGIEINKFEFNENNRKKIRNELEINDKETIIGLVAMLTNQKNHDFLIEIFNEYLKMNNNSKLLLIGEGYLKNEIQNKAKELKIINKIIFLGKKNNVNEILSAMDIYVMPSLYEGLSIALCEAQVNGLKCYTSTGVDVASNISGNVEFLDLDKCAKYWAEYIYNSNNERDNNVIEKIPEKFDANKSYEKIYQFYKNNL